MLRHSEVINTCLKFRILTLGHVRQRGVNSGVLEVAIGQAALGGIWAGCASLCWVLSSAMASTCM